MTPILIVLGLLTACSVYGDVSHLGYNYQAPVRSFDIGINPAAAIINPPSHSDYKYNIDVAPVPQPAPITVNMPQNTYVPPRGNEVPESIYGPPEAHKVQQNFYEPSSNIQEQQEQQHVYVPEEPIYSRPIFQVPQDSYAAMEPVHDNRDQSPASPNQPPLDLGYKYEAPIQPAHIDIPLTNPIHPTPSDSGYKFEIPALPQDTYIPPQPIPEPQNIYIPPQPIPEPQNIYIPPQPIPEPQNIYIPPETHHVPQNTYVPPAPQYEVVEVLTPQGYRTERRLKKTF